MENNVESWSETWFVQCNFHPLKITLARNKDSALVYCRNGVIYELKLSTGNKPNLEEIFNDCRKFKFICTLKPHEENIVLVDDANNLSAVNMFDGKILDTQGISEENKGR